MKVITKLFPFIPKKADTTKLIISLLFYGLGPMVATPIVTIILSLTLVLAVLIPIIIPLMFLYGFAGVIFAILSFAGVMNFEGNT